MIVNEIKIIPEMGSRGGARLHATVHAPIRAVLRGVRDEVRDGTTHAKHPCHSQSTAARATWTALCPT
ncbi:hypothetical protein CAURIC_04945 [Corynebacterium auriscanis]|nr:hypothetical protein CAURIC_04945 [Corynebacterium auriscanis]